MLKTFYGTSKLVGFILLMYGGLLALIPDVPFLNVVGIFSYYGGAWQMCLSEPYEGEDQTA